MNRRLFLQSGAGAIGALWLGAAGARPATAGDDGPWAAWSEQALRAHADPRLRAIAHAILVPNPQNLQPWLCEFPVPGRIVLRAVPDRKLAVSDYPDRQVTVGCGTFAEVLVLALEAEGLAAKVTPFPEGEPWPTLDQRPVAVFELTPAPARRDPLLDQLLKRHTNRTPFDTARPPSAQQLAAIRAAAHWPERVHVNLDPARAARIRDIVLRAWDLSMVEFAPTRAEVAQWTRIGTAAIAASPYGPSMPDAAVAAAPGPVSVETLSDPASAIFRRNRDNYRRAVETGQAHLWIASPAYDRRGAFEAGRDWVRVHLKATALGLHMQPHSQPLFDFAQVVPYLKEIHQALEVPHPGRIQMLGRIGHGSEIGPSPRADAATHVSA